jgi:hypothetical protein
LQGGQVTRDCGSASHRYPTPGPAPGPAPPMKRVTPPQTASLMARSLPALPLRQSLVQTFSVTVQLVERSRDALQRSGDALISLFLRHWVTFDQSASWPSWQEYPAGQQGEQRQANPRPPPRERQQDRPGDDQPNATEELHGFDRFLCGALSPISSRSRITSERVAPSALALASIRRMKSSGRRSATSGGLSARAMATSRLIASGREGAGTCPAIHLSRSAIARA